MQRGFVLNIQRYCVHDGPGIRTTVFLKGCPLRCWWCHNPESQSVGAEIGFIGARCVRCGQCGEACPQRPSDVAPGPLPGNGSTEDRCTRCGACVDACPTGAREFLGREMTSGEVLEEVLHDRIFFEDSGGGVTFSGGEPLLQADFLSELLQRARGASIHTTVDTCGYAQRETLLALAPLVDLFLYDIKAIDDDLHLRLTGVPNAVILENLTVLAACHGNIWIRIPLIPGVNDAPEQLRVAARFIRALPGVRLVNLLPYHQFGVHKARQAAADRAGAKPPSVAQLQVAATVFQEAGLHIGWVDDQR